MRHVPPVSAMPVASETSSWRTGLPPALTTASKIARLPEVAEAPAPVVDQLIARWQRLPAAERDCAGLGDREMIIAAADPAVAAKLRHVRPPGTPLRTHVDEERELSGREARWVLGEGGQDAALAT